MEANADVGDTRDVVSRVRQRLFGGPAPTTIGRYELRRVIGRGGLGVVYEAYDPQLDRLVAIKLVAGGGQERELRMLREARALARLNHRNVVAVHDAGMGDDGVFVAMELVRGCNLSEWLRQAQPSPDAIFERLRQAGEGLVAAHHAGIVHRDVKPANILVDAAGSAQIADFGLARAAGPPAARDRSTLDVELTATGACIGTPAYMAPEQFEGAPLDERTDQWAFCVTAWEALTGARPFTSKTFEALREEVRRGAPDVGPPAGVAAPVWSAIRRGLAVDPAARHPDLAALLLAMRPRPKRGRSQRNAVALLAVVVGAGAVAAVATAQPGATAGAVSVDDLKAAWTTPNQIRWAWSAQGAPDALAEYRLVTGPSRRDVEERTAAATVWTSEELPALGHFLRPLTEARSPVAAVTTYGYAPDGLVHAQLIAVDTHGRSTASGIAVGRTTPSPVDEIVLFRDADPPGYSIPREFDLAHVEPHNGASHLQYTVRCDAEPCYVNLRRQGVAQRLDAMTQGMYATTAFFEIALAVDAPGPAWWSAVRLWYGDGAREQIGYFEGFAVPATGDYHVVQVPLRALVSDGEPVGYNVVAQGLHEWGIGGSWRRDAVVRIDDVRIRW